MKSSTMLGIVVVLIIIVVGAALYLSSSPSSAPATNNGELTPNNISDPSQPSGTENTGTQNGGADVTNDGDTPVAVLVALTSSGFSPEIITIPRGSVVTWNNEGGGSMWVASAAHPAHVVYDDTTRSEHCVSGYSGPIPFDQCENSSRYSFTFEQSGTWQYHNHLNASQTGTVIVE